MFSVGDTVFYEAHGVCTVSDIQDQTFAGKTKAYYILRSHQNESLTLYHLVESKQSKLTHVASKERAKIILETFKKSPEPWLEQPSERSQLYRRVLESNDHIQIAQMTNTILRKEAELVVADKKLHNQDSQLLKRVLPNLYNELAVSLKISADDVKNKIDKMIAGA